MTRSTTKAGEKRRQQIIDVLGEAFAPLMEADPAAFRVKYRKMAADPFAFYRGSACLFFADVTSREDEWSDDRTSQIWIHGDLHARNFGSYMNSDGRLVFDVNDFDEAYVGHYTWDLQRFAASLALLGWQKALPEKDVRSLIARYVRAYLAQVSHYVESKHDHDWALTLDTSEGLVRDVLQQARCASRVAMLDSMTHLEDGVRKFDTGGPARRLSKAERRLVEKAFEEYLGTIPESKRVDRALFYSVRDVIGMSGFGIGSAGLPAYSVLVEGFSQSLDNDVVLSMKQANVPAVSRFVDRRKVEAYFSDEGQRTVVSQRALQSHTDPSLGHTTVRGVGYVVAEVSPYEMDLDWGAVNEPSELAPVVDDLGRATAKIHCASDEDSDQSLVTFQVEEAIAECLQGRRRAFTDAICDFGIDYAVTVRQDHAHFVEAFREGRIGIKAT